MLSIRSELGLLHAYFTGPAVTILSAGVYAIYKNKQNNKCVLVTAYGHAARGEVSRSLRDSHRTHKSHFCTASGSDRAALCLKGLPTHSWSDCVVGRWAHLTSGHAYWGTLALVAFLASAGTAIAHNLGYPGKIKAPKVRLTGETDRETGYLYRTARKGQRTVRLGPVLVPVS